MREQEASVASMTLVGGMIFDGTGRAPFCADVQVEDGRISKIGMDLARGPTIDVAGCTILPGLIDCHAHLAFADMPGSEEAMSRSPTYNALRATSGMHATLAAGITAVRDAGGADAGFRRAVEEGLVPGPRMLVSLMQLSPGAGPYDARTPSGLDAWIDVPGIPRPVANGVDGVRAKVREYVQAGADVIKIFATGNFSMPRGGARRQLFRDDELQAIVDEARAQGIPVMAHAHGGPGAEAAARAGVTSIEHGVYLDHAALEAMLECGTVLVPTLLASAGLVEAAATEPEKQRMRAVAQGHREVVRKAHELGVSIAMGTDSPVVAHGRNLEELSLLAECGLSPAEALVAATSNAARLLGMESEIGSVEPGKRADLVVVTGDALQGDFIGQRIESVYRDGVRVRPLD